MLDLCAALFASHCPLPISLRLLDIWSQALIQSGYRSGWRSDDRSVCRSVYNAGAHRCWGAGV